MKFFRLVAILLLASCHFATRVVGEEPSDPVAARKYSVALGFQKKQLYEQAATRWQEFIGTYPQDKRVSIAYHHLGTCQIEQEKFGEAAATFRKLLSDYPNFPKLDGAQFNLGLALYNMALASKKPEDFQAAVAVFAELPTKFPQSALKPTALYYQAECLCLAGRLAEAVPIYQRVLSEHGDSPLAPKVYYSLGATLQDLSKEVDAAAALKTLLDKYPQDALASDARLRLAESLFRQKKYAEAEPLFLQLSKTADFPSADLALLKYAQTLFELGKVAEAAVQYEALPATFPKSPHIGLSLLSAGQCRYRAGQYPQAQADFVAAIQGKHPSAPEAASWLGKTLLQLGNPMEALQKLDQAIAEYPQSEFLPLCKFTRAEAIAAIDLRRTEAVQLFAQFAIDHPQHEKAAEAVYRAASLAVQLGDYAAARTHCESFLKNESFRKGKLLPAILLTAGHSQLQGKPSDPMAAEVLFRRLVTEFPNDALVPQAQLGIGGCLFASKQYQPAIDHLTKTAGAFNNPAMLAESRLLIGRCQLAGGRASDAIASLRSAFDAKPDWAHVDEVLLMLGSSLLAVGQHDAAIVELQKLLNAHPKSQLKDQALFQMGQIYFQKKEYDQAIGQYQALISQIPKSSSVPAALHGTAAAQLEKKDHKGATATLDKLIAEHASSEWAVRAKYLRGLSRLASSDHSAAMNDLSDFIAQSKSSPDLPSARLALARCQAALKQFDAAITSLTTLLQEKPDYSRQDDAYYELAFAYLGAGKRQEGLAAFQTLLKKSPMGPHSRDAWYRIGKLYEQSAELEKAAQAYDAGLNCPGSTELHEQLLFQLGSVRYKLERYVEAEQVVRLQIKEFGEGKLNPAATYLLGDCLFQQKKYAEALPVFITVSNLQDKESESLVARALYRCGMCSANLEDWKASQQHYEKLIERFPKSDLIPEGRYGLGMALVKQQQLGPARTAFKTVTETVPQSQAAAKSWFMMGQCWFAEKNFNEAIACFSEVAFGFKDDEWQPLSYFEAGRCYLQLNNPTAARKMLTALVQEFPKHPRASDAQSILKEIEK